MKSLLLIRHAKSSWTSEVLQDFDRPLNERGKKEAPAMAKKLLKDSVKIDGFVSSPAKRAKKTARLFIKEFGRDEEDLVFFPELYHAGVDDFLHVIGQFSDEWDTVAVFSHNPGITEFVNTLTDTRIDNMPTCAVFAVKAPIRHWKKFAEAEKEFWFFNYPKLDGDL